MEDILRYLNDAISGKPYSGPKYIYKYRPFDNYTFDMLEHEYIYLCPAEKLDDITECISEIRKDYFFDLQTNKLKQTCVDFIIELLRPHMSQKDYEAICNAIKSISREDGTIYPNYLLDLSFEIQNRINDGTNIAPFVNWLINIPDELEKNQIQDRIYDLIDYIFINGRKKMGICSLSSDRDNEKMWEEYASNSSGYCIEYDMENYDYLEYVFPVCYVEKEKRETELMQQILKNFISECVYSYSNGKNLVDRTQLLRLFLTKYDDWKYQNEWRILYDAGTKLKAPKIKAIYVRSKISKENYLELKFFCDKKGISLIQL